MPTLYLLIGGNQGDRRQMITHATDLIRQRIGSVVACSHIYETAPWGRFAPDERPQGFYNQALEVTTDLPPHDALREALCIERILGRQRGKVESSPSAAANSQLSIHNSKLYTSRPIDIDLIFYNSIVVDSPDLTLPHPRMHLRRFVLVPMCDIASNYTHPILNKTMKQLLDECTDTSYCLRCC